jgi:iron complex outermembrane receptor protein
VPKTELLHNGSTNIIDALASQPGISQITTGSGISKPVIRGLGYNRVVTVNDDIRQEGQQWGDEHGIEIDEYSVNRVEILKGPASLSYGSDAIAGVIHLMSAPPLQEGKIIGELTTGYQTNNGLLGYSLNFAGNRKGFIWDARFSNKLAHAYQNKYDGYVFNSGYRELAGSALVGINRPWGFSHLKFSAYHLMPGIIEGERDSLTGKFTKVVITEDVTEDALANNSDFKSYTPTTPFQQIYHYKLVSNSNFILGQGNLKTVVGFQQNRRQEYEESKDEYGLYFLLNTLNYDFKYNLPEYTGFDISFGINGMQQNSLNKGSEYLVPEYNLFDYGVFATASKSLGNWDVSGGFRFDTRNEKGKDLFLDENDQQITYPAENASHRFSAFNSTFRGTSGSIGVTWQIMPSLYTKLNLSRGFRAPNIAELGSNGVHEGTFRYEIGDPDLKPETSNQLDYTFGLSREHISAEINAFYNDIDHFIYSRKLNAINGSDSIIDNNIAFKYQSGNARLLGGEIRFDIHPHPYDWIHFENTFSYVNALLKNQPDSSRYLPLTPAPKWQSSLQVDIPKDFKHLDNLYIKLSLENYFEQDHYYSAYNTETATPGYTLWNIGSGTDFIKGSKKICSLFITVNNLTNKAYQSHLSRLKYAGTNYVTGRTGIYNMGRNVGFKLIIPIDFGD